MLRIRRTDEREVIDCDGRAYTLVSRTWTVHLAALGLGLGYSYRRPFAVEGPSLTVTIVDHLMFARMAALALLAASALIRRRGL